MGNVHPEIPLRLSNYACNEKIKVIMLFLTLENVGTDLSNKKIKLCFPSSLEKYAKIG